MSPAQSTRGRPPVAQTAGSGDPRRTVACFPVGFALAHYLLSTSPVPVGDVTDASHPHSTTPVGKSLAGAGRVRADFPYKGGKAWDVEKMILHGAHVPGDFVALSLPPSWGRAKVGGLRAPGLDPSAVQVPNRGIRPPTLILPHTGGGDQTRNRTPFYNSSARNKNRHV